jgi:hypothetical protein
MIPPQLSDRNRRAYRAARSRSGASPPRAPGGRRLGLDAVVHVDLRMSASSFPPTAASRRVSRRLLTSTAAVRPSLGVTRPMPEYPRPPGCDPPAHGGAPARRRSPRPASRAGGKRPRMSAGWRRGGSTSPAQGRPTPRALELARPQPLKRPLGSRSIARPPERLGVRAAARRRQIGLGEERVDRRPKPRHRVASGAQAPNGPPRRGHRTDDLDNLN